MKAYLSRGYQLSASHRLFCPELGLEENLSLFGKCANPHGHGHNYQVQVTLSGDVDPILGMVYDLGKLDACVEAEVMAQYDHTNLNLHPDFAELVPTTENFAMTIYRRLAEALGLLLVELRIEETANNAFVYAGGAAPIESRMLERVRQEARA